MSKYAAQSQLQFLRQSARLEESPAPYQVRFTMLALTGLVILFVVWAALTEIEEIAPSSGEVVPGGLPRIIQHYDGGIVKEILVRDGDEVKEGDMLLRLDGAGTEEDLKKAIIASNGLEKAANTAREIYRIQENLKLQGVASQLRFLEAGRAKDVAESELNQQKEVILRLKEKSDRLDIRSPVTGIIKGLKINTIGAVIKSGDPILEIIPTGEILIVETRISPSDMGNISVGQNVKVKINSFDYGRYGTIEGTLDSVSATTFDGEHGTKYYRGRIILKQNYVGNHKEMKIIPGMTVQAGIITGRKTVLGYLLKPIQRAMSDALNEK